VTDTGKVIAMLVMITGIGFVALLTASIAERFVSRDIATPEALHGQQLALQHAQLAAPGEQLDRIERALASRSPARGGSSNSVG
jgi:hypothetical protein